MRKKTRGFLLFMLLILQPACMNVPGLAPFIQSSRAGIQLRAGKARWEQKNIRNYRIQVSEISMWHMQTVDVTVLDGNPAAHTAFCTPAPIETQGCQVQPYDPQDYAVPALFRRVEGFINMDENSGLEWKAEFDRIYGYPRSLTWDSSRATDVMGALQVTLFEEVEAPQGQQPASPQPSAVPAEDVPALPDADTRRQIVQAVLGSSEQGTIWAAQPVEGSFSAPDAREMLALVGGIPEGEGSKVCWTLLASAGETWDVSALSAPVGRNWSGPLPSGSPRQAWSTPQLTDFDHDGLQEAWIQHRREDLGWQLETVYLYRWDGRMLAGKVLGVPVLDDNTRVTRGNNPQIYRHAFSATMEWQESAGAADTLLVHETVQFYDLHPSGKGADLESAIGERRQEIALLWDGKSFQPLSAAMLLGKLPYPLTPGLYPWWNPQDLPGFLADEVKGKIHRIHFLSPDGSEKIQEVEQDYEFFDYATAAQRLFLGTQVVLSNGSHFLEEPGQAGTPSVLPSEDGEQLAWLTMDNQYLKSGRADFRLVITNAVGKNAHLVWEKSLPSSDGRTFALAGWRADGQAVYLSQPAYPGGQTRYVQNPGLLEVDVSSGAQRLLGDLEMICDAAGSPDGRWIAQTECRTKSGRPYLHILVRPQSGGEEQRIEALEGALEVGHYAFSPDGTHLAWEEWSRVDGRESIRVRLVRLPGGTPELIHTESAPADPRARVLRGWLRPDLLVMAYLSEDAGPGTYVAQVGETPRILPLSPYRYLGK